METFRPSDMSSRPAGCDRPEPRSSASPKNEQGQWEAATVIILRHSKRQLRVGDPAEETVPSIKTALRTANTAPTTMLFWEAARRWRSQDDRMPTGDLSVESRHERLTQDDESSESVVRGVCLWSSTWLHAVLRDGVSLRCLKKVQ